jgi:hypothetical protein
LRFRFHLRASLILLAAFLALPAGAQTAYKPPAHVADWPGLTGGTDQESVTASLDAGPDLERGRSAKALLDDHRRLDRALDALVPQRKGVVDAYVVSIALDSDPVFGREAREAGKVLARRFDAEGRTIVLAGSNGAGPTELPLGSIDSLTLALARVAELMDKNEDVLVLYSTSHGAQVGIAYHDGDQGFGILAPKRLAAILDELGIKRRVLILSACYSGVFVPVMSNEDTALFTAASSERTSFGCRAENDWTFFGDAMINHALRKPQSLGDASDEARATIAQWEGQGRLPSSNPQVSVGDNVATWLPQLEARMPKTATEPVGRPATDALKGN